jgi:hypothetical protein
MIVLPLSVTLRYQALAGGGHPLRFAVRPILPYAETVPDGGRQGSRRLRPPEPPSSSGLGHRPFKAAARVRIPLGARSPRVGDKRSCRAARSARHPVKVEVAGSNPVRTAGTRWRACPWPVAGSRTGSREVR